MNAIFLDRDGVLLREPLFDPSIGPTSEVIDSLDKFEILPSVKTAFTRLKDTSYHCFVITNQDGLADGSLSSKLYLEMNGRLCRFISSETGARIDSIYTCPHAINSGCSCRKPKRGLIDQALNEHPDIDLSGTWLIGDRQTDIALAHNIGVRSIFIAGEHSLSPEFIPDHRAADLADAVDHILAGHSPK
ncbi:hypothetical protein AUK40_01950 [Candidatus Wirthbacteria bacterium CG2_30_54_11]|uniref:D,D-heptose 1,7-bisphosphate phosphatase n=1 Tax=Candidatus Wirthbacteria bacterium CG2_30_54_11 TaxID=1817892 RepID=A0A1J5ILT7_9BACT|nr:MAG: hypothetical protein AUK40_01950 [Candidatus Wirthbacteria bacterium CG2_30_54_11]